MESLFLKVLNMSITATWLALAVIALRLLLRRAPSAIRVVMWALVGLRLMCPISVKSMLSLIPSTETLPENILYPQYFNLPTDKGLVVYLWQFGPATYYCGLVDGRNIGHTDEEILRLQGIGIPEMRAIVESYGIEKDRVSIRHIRHPLSSYWGAINDETAKEVFWKTGEIGETPEFSTIMAAKTFDVDGDGRQENCVLSFGPTSGLFTVVLAAAEQGQARQEYRNTFQLPGGGSPISFEECENGTVQLVFFQNSVREVRYDISVKDGNLVLSLDGKQVPYYGKQGVIA